MKVKSPRPPVKRLTYHQRETELRAFVALCFASLEQQDGRLDLKEVCNSSHLSLATLYRYRQGKVYLRCQYR